MRVVVPLTSAFSSLIVWSSVATQRAFSARWTLGRPYLPLCSRAVNSRLRWNSWCIATTTAESHNSGKSVLYIAEASCASSAAFALWFFFSSSSLVRCAASSATAAPT